MSIFIVGLVLLFLVGCATKPIGPVSPLAPYQLTADFMVVLEDGCEDPHEDAQTLTALEATADMFALPGTMAVYTLRLAAYVTVGVGMVLAGNDAHATLNQINFVLPFPTAGPNPDHVKYHKGMVRASCLVAKQ